MSARRQAIERGRTWRHRANAVTSRAGEAAQRKRRGSRASRVLSARADTERAFLALCIATPEYGERALEEVDLDGVFTSELLRRAAAHLKAGHLASRSKMWTPRTASWWGCSPS